MTISRREPTPGKLGGDPGPGDRAAVSNGQPHSSTPPSEIQAPSLAELAASARTLHDVPPEEARQTVLLENLPEALRALNSWVNWCLEPDEDGRMTKVPYQPRGRRPAKSNDSTTWGSYAQAVKHYQRNEWVTGLGIVFSGRLIGVDLDHCVIDGKIQPWARQIIQELDSYTELSQSGTGIHILCWGDLPEGRRNVRLPELGEGAGIEMYGAGSPKFFVVTGKVIHE